MKNVIGLCLLCLAVPAAELAGRRIKAGKAAGLQGLIAPL